MSEPEDIQLQVELPSRPAPSIEILDENDLVDRYAPVVESEMNRRAKRLVNETLAGDWTSLQKIKISDWDLAQFARALGTMYNSGVALTRAFEVLSASTESVEWSLVTAAINRDLQQGKNPVTAFGAFPNVFGSTWTALLRQGMENGSLGDSFNALSRMHERNAELKAKVRAASTYPIIIFVVCGLVALIACVFVLPSLLEGITAGDKPIPLMTKILIAIVDVASNPIFLAAAGGVLWFNIRLFKGFISTYRGRLRFDMLAIRMPLVGRVVRLVAVTKLLHTLQASIKAGTRITVALDLAGAAAGNAIYRLHMMRCIEGLTDGRSLASMFAPPNRLYDPMVYYTIYIGEESGSLDSLLEAIANYYDVEVRSTLDNTLTALEPLMVAGMGLIVAFVLMAIFLPLYGQLSGE